MTIGTPTTIGSNNAKTGVTSVAVTVPGGGVPSGTTIFVSVATSSTSFTRSLADTAGNTYTLDASQARGTGPLVELYRASNVTALSSGDTITYTISGGSISAAAISAFYCNGLDTASPLDGTPVGNSGSSASPNSTSLTTANANDLLVGLVGLAGPNEDTFTQDASPSFSTPPDQNGTTAGSAASNASLRGGSVVVSSTGSYDYSPTITSRAWVALIAAYKAAGGGAAYTLSAGAGSYAITGQAATLRAARLVSAVAGAYAVTGTAASLKLGRRVSAVAGAYAVAGASASLLQARKISAAAGAYTITGTDATLVYTPVAGSYVLSAGGGAYTITGSSAALRRALKVSASAGAYTLAGQAASLVRGRLIAGGAGAYVLTGATASLIARRILSGLPGSYVITGTAAAFIYSGAHSDQFDYTETHPGHSSPRAHAHAATARPDHDPATPRGPHRPSIERLN